MPFSVVLVVVFLNVVLLHKRSFASVFNSIDKFRFRRFAIAFIIWMVLMGLVDIIYCFYFHGNYIVNFDHSHFLKLLLISLSLFPIQTLAEEIFFRSYILQGLSNIFRRALFPVLISSILFMLLHLANPENEKFGYGLMIMYYLVSGIFLAVITTLDEGIEQSFGIHTATNIYGAVIVGYEGSALETDSLFSIQNPSGMIMVISTFAVMIFYFIFSKYLFKFQDINYLIHDFKKEDDKLPDLS
ncbi:MAG: CPBP family intramembrane glutamic endopeptidase [Saprospiraceae bacterium]